MPGRSLYAKSFSTLLENPRER
eukprot:CCRYP_014406-RA/>CCRYP_014406-RA protein AED:0.42 eAED:0.42 QI:0/-1/0/1/-1/0/1/0/21